MYIILTQGDAGKEGLRARNMSIVSPRSFWSMVYHFKDAVEEGLKTLLPRVDWSLLDHRKRGKSKIALEAEESKKNFDAIDRDYKRQKKEIEKSKKESSEPVLSNNSNNSNNNSNNNNSSNYSSNYSNNNGNNSDNNENSRDITIDID
jgi:ABC-type antimicrobial peptide transport system permease subunit